MTRVIALVDLDDTLFQTRRKCPPDLAEDRLTPLGFARNGASLSYATPAQLNLLHWLDETAELVPVTARSRDALMRAHVPHRTAICAHGGVILHETGVDQGWSARMAEQAALERDTLTALASALSDAARAQEQPVTVRVLQEGDTPLYLLAKHDAADADALHGLVRGIAAQAPAGWTMHLNDNNAALLPPHLGKEHAVAHLLPRLREAAPDAVVIGIGDSRTDAPFLALCDFAMLPTQSQLAERLFDAG